MMCSSCDEDFDDQSRGLQLLKCSHTLCQLCVKELRHSDVITCNVCQVTTECRDLRNATTNERFLSNQVETEIVWCLTCGAPSTTSCPDHRTVHVPSQSLSTCKELQVKIENCKHLASSVVQLRQSVVEQLSDKFKWLNSTADDVKRQLDELGQKFTSLTSTAADVQNQLTENQSKLQEASNWLANFNTAVNGQQTLKSLKEQVEAADQKWNSEFQEMSCLIKDLKSKNVENMETDEAVASTSTNDRSQRGARSEYKIRRQVSSVPREERHLHQRRHERHHQLTIQDGDSLMGRIVIKAFWLIRSNFIMDLRDFCSKRPQNFRSHVSRAVPHDCLTLEFSSVRFAPGEEREGEPINSHSDDRVDLKRLTASDDKRTRWQLVFNLGQSNRRGPKLDCLGHVISGRELLQLLARKPPSSTIFVNWEYLE